MVVAESTKVVKCLPLCSWNRTRPVIIKSSGKEAANKHEGRESTFVHQGLCSLAILQNSVEIDQFSPTFRSCPGLGSGQRSHAEACLKEGSTKKYTGAVKYLVLPPIFF